jgi:hypothetical protein
MTIDEWVQKKKIEMVDRKISRLREQLLLAKMQKLSLGGEVCKDTVKEIIDAFKVV